MLERNESKPAPVIQPASRGIAPRALLDQVGNTAPYLFVEGRAGLARRDHLGVIADFDERLASPPTSPSPSKDDGLTGLEYFQLCVAAHWTTVATFVPTDVDNQIRFKLWNSNLPTPELVQMSEWTLAIRSWDSRLLSRRFVEVQGEILSGHDGEWFSVAAAAYGVLRRRAPEQAAVMAGAILEEVQKHARIFERLTRLPKNTANGLMLLKASTLIAHNLGDLARVFEQWNIPADDPLVGEPGRSPFLVAAGALNKSMMAVENHRHFALRKPRALRRSPDLLVGIGPFFDDWGRLVARHPALSKEDVAEVVEALHDGWARLAGTAGYVRAIAGILESFPGGLEALCRYLPAKLARTLRAGEFRQLSSVSRERFEDKWSQTAYRTLDATSYK